MFPLYFPYFWGLGFLNINTGIALEVVLNVPSTYRVQYLGDILTVNIPDVTECKMLRINSSAKGKCLWLNELLI